MSVLLSIYSEKAFKDFILPTSSNLDTTFVLREDIFSLKENVSLRLENVDGEWYFLPSEQYRVVVQGQAYGHTKLAHGDYYQLEIDAQHSLAVMVHMVEQNVGGFAKYHLTRREITIGAAPECALRYTFSYRNAQYISQKHAMISTNEEGLLLTDTSKNGTFVNDLRINGSCQLRFGDQVDLWGLRLVALGTTLAVRLCDGLEVDSGQLRPGDVSVQKAVPHADRVIHYHRSPRKIGRLEEGEVEIEQPPTLQQQPEPPLFMTVGPALTMTLPMISGSLMAVVGANSGGGLYMYTGLVTAVLSALIGAMWAVINVRFSRKQRKQEETQRFEAYGDYLLRITEEIRRKYEHNSKVLQETYPAAGTCVEDGLQIQHLWERNAKHSDFLTYRLGLGDRPFQMQIRVPPEKFELLDDSLRKKPQMILENYQTLHHVPVCVDLCKEHVIGLAGGPAKAGAKELVKLLVAQIAAQNCYTDVKLVFAFHESQGDDLTEWSYCRWLPHVWSQDKKSRYVATNPSEASDVFYELTRILRSRSELSQSSEKDEMPLPWYVLIIEDISLLENEPIAKYLFDPSANLGVTTLLLVNRPEELPNVCECVVRKDESYTGIYHLRAEDEEEGRATLDTVDTASLEAFARRLANVEVSEAEVGGEIPNAVTFLDMYNVTRLQELLVEERWKKNRTYETMRALIGQKGGNQPCYLDVHEKYHGPHGLVAGTTGSGKSETLQTYILSLAINFSPYDVGFFIIDYKGGGMANLFNGLPHMMGQISNLSGSQVQRAMVSIKSENMRRQRIFNDHGVNNINLYTTLYKNGEASIPVPHLFIVIDEFAELKREQPEFMQELISVAQVGRSLGVHLILATQRPSGTVDDNIWSNSKFHLCLRVQDRQDSMDMLHKPDAAYLTQAGRGFLQVGNDELYEQFQSGWSGAIYDEESESSKQVIARMLSETGKTALVGGYIKRRQKEKAYLRWLEQLLQCLEQAEAGLSPEEREDEEKLCANLYRTMNEQEIPYPESERNTALLKNLIRLARLTHTAGDSRETWAEKLRDHAKQEKAKLPEMKEKTQLDAVVEYLAKLSKAQGFAALPPLWLPPLPDHLYLDQTEGWKETTVQADTWPAYEKKWELEAVVGQCDDPASQAQFPLTINFTKGGHHALIGSASSGKSTFVQTLVYALIHRYSPSYLNLYILDFSSRMCSPFEGEAHVGGVLYESDLEQVGKLFYFMQVLIAERKKLFRGGSYEQYVMVHGVVCPAVVLIIDNIANFWEKTGEAYEEVLLQLSREGVGYGIYLLLTGAGYNMSEIPSQLAGNLRTSLSLELTDIYQYSDVLRGPQPQILPESGVHGRGLANVDGTVLEFQTAQAVPAEDDYTRMELIRAECQRLNALWKGSPARPIPFIPAKPTWNDLIEREEIAALQADRYHLPIGYDKATAGIFSLDFRRFFCYTVSGRARTGKTNVLRLILRSAAAKGCHLTVLEPKGASLKAEAQRVQAEYCTNLEEIVAFVGKLAVEFQTRHAVKRELTSQGAEEEELFERLSQYTPWIVVISDLADFVNLTYSADGRMVNLYGALENLIGHGFLHNIYFIAGLNQDQLGEVMGQPVYDLFVRDKTGMHVGGNTAAQRLFDFSTLPYQEQSIAEKPGTGLVPLDGGYRRIVLPLAKN